jgi:hypothetical protein
VTASSTTTALPDHDFWMSAGRVLVMVYGDDGFDHVVEVTDPVDIARYDQWRTTAWDNSQEWQCQTQ